MAPDPATGLGMREGIRRSRAWQYAILCIAVAAPIAGCTAPQPDANTAAGNVVRPGIDVLLTDSLHRLQGLRVGLITNQTGVTGDARSTIDALRAAPGVDLVALFSPEHGIRGQADPGERVADDFDDASGLPIRSLYGETRKPTAAMLADIDVLVFDIQDIGVRYYTYVWTMALAMQAAAENGKAIIVLDRPNPIGGARVDGNVLDPAFASFVGLYPVPMRHGMTVGELALLANTAFEIGADLTVIPMTGWDRARWFDDTGLRWIAPSPNMPTLESATHYAGTCLFEGTNLSVGRGTDAPFQQIGAPWLDSHAVVRDVESRSLPGVRFEAVEFTPVGAADGKYDGIAAHGIRLIVTDRSVYDPVRAAVILLAAVRATHPAEFRFNEASFDRLAGTDALRRALVAEADPDSIVHGWRPQLEAFEQTRARFLLYR